MTNRKYPVGAEVLPGGGVSFRVWAPNRKRVEVIPEAGSPIELKSAPGGYFEGAAPDVSAGTRYKFRLDGGDSFPDPASRFQPDGPHGSSQVVDPTRFAWTDDAWSGKSIHGQVIYEMHVGTFTPEGTWRSAQRELPHLADLGITVVELMPVAEFPGKFGWGYDGVGWFAPFHYYGDPDDFRAFVDQAHRLGIGVILDVVYNHVGPDGNYLKQFADGYFTDRYENEWGEAINFDGPDSAGTREFVCANAAYWADEFHLDGLRLDATQQIFDSSPENIMARLCQDFRAAAAPRQTLIVAENEPQHTRLVRPIEKGGYGIDGLWNDDYHHSIVVAATGHKEAYYTDYSGAPQEFISAVKYGYLLQGQRYQWQNKPRGTPAWGIGPEHFINYIQNHDQIANSGRGERLHQLTSPGRCRAVTALTLLAPGTPMLFQGQEFAAATPFFYFADHEPNLRKLVGKGRLKFLRQFPSLAQPAVQRLVPDPGDPATFEQCKLEWTQLQSHAHVFQLHRDLLRLRREDPVFRAQQPHGVDGAVLAPEAFVLRFFEGPGPTSGHDRLLFVNLGRDLLLDAAPEPLLAPPEGLDWQILWSSEDPRYGGSGTPPFPGPKPKCISAHSAMVMIPCQK